MKGSSKEKRAKWGNANQASLVPSETTTTGNHEDDSSAGGGGGGGGSGGSGGKVGFGGEGGHVRSEQQKGWPTETQAAMGLGTPWQPWCPLPVA